MAKRTVFGTSLTIRQVKSLMRKVAEIEKRQADKETAPPDLIMISYTSGKWVIFEDFMNKEKTFRKRETKEVDSLQEYVFRENFHGQCLLDLMELPEGNVYSFNVGMLRAEHGLLKKEFSLEFLGHPHEMNGEFNLIVFE